MEINLQLAHRIKQLSQETKTLSLEVAALSMNRESQELVYNVGALTGLIVALLPEEPMFVVPEPAK